MSKFSPKDAEDYVAARLLSRGFKILARNYRNIGFELDIVAAKNQTLVVVEVKKRRRRPASAEEFARILPDKKTRSLTHGARHFLVSSGWRCSTVRFDLALVLKKGPAVLPDLFYFTDVIRI